MKLAWGKRVSENFRLLVVDMSHRLAVDPSWLMTAMAFETGRTFSASIRNAAGSGAVGLIQFMPVTAGLLGTTTDALERMMPETQLGYVEKYFQPYAGRMKNLGDVYCAVLWPSAIGCADDYVVFVRGGDRPKQYLQNAGLDANRDGDITRGEICARIYAMYDEGVTPENLWTGDDE